MAGLGNNLYPPIFKKAYIPAFDKNGECLVYFSLSVYNSLDDFAHYKNANGEIASKGVADLVQISIQNQNTNYSALNLNYYPSGIMNTTMYEDTSLKTDERYYVKIRAQDLEGEEFLSGQYYKLQIRFTNDSLQLPAQNEVLDESWYNSHLASFSEWSQVVLIKGIQKPKLKLRSFDSDAKERTFTLQDIYLVGTVQFGEQDNEYLKKYRILLYDSQNQIIEDSGEKYSNIYTNPNEIYYKIKYNLKNEETYTVKFELQSNNLYEWTEEYTFTMQLVQYTTLDSSNYKIQAQADNSGGRIKVIVTSKEKPSSLGMNLIIRRSSSKDNFDVWEDMYTFLAQPTHEINLVWYDKTVESGIWYKYSLQQRNLQGFRSNFIEYQTPIMCVFEDIFLVTAQNQLKIRFNPQVNNYSHVVAESLTQTIGSKYPFIRRNGNVNYRTFSLSGTITHFMDARQNGMHASPLDLYGTNSIAGKNKYDEYNSRHGIDMYNNSIYERDFRQKVIEFLYKNNVKLYKSTTQGNILVKLMNISFTPNNTLSRHIYDFTCTVQQVDQFTVENCDKYNIQEKGQYSNKTEVNLTRQGQVMIPDYNLYYKTTVNDNDAEDVYKNRQIYNKDSSLTFGGGYDNSLTSGQIIKNYIAPKYYNLKTDLIDIKVDYLSYLKIELTSPPYLISKSSSMGLKICEGSEQPIYLGHLVNINGQIIVIGPEGIYELADNTTKVQTLSFVSSQETGVISYEAVVVEFEQSSLIPKTYENIYKIGQFFGFFKTFDSIFKKIYSKYYYASYQSVKGIEQDQEDLKLNMSQELQQVKGMRIYAAPNTVVRVKEAQDNTNASENNYDTFLIGPTGLLEFYDENTNIKGVYIQGIKLHKNNNKDIELTDSEYYYELNDSDYYYSSIEEITNPKKNHVYTIVDKESLNIIKTRLFSTAEENMQGVVLVENEEIAAINYETAQLMGKALSNITTCIYYGGGWYLFSPQEQMVMGVPIQAIIDYYCQILRKGY